MIEPLYPEDLMEVLSNEDKAICEINHLLLTQSIQKFPVVLSFTEIFEACKHLKFEKSDFDEIFEKYRSNGFLVSTVPAGYGTLVYFSRERQGMVIESYPMPENIQRQINEAFAEAREEKSK